MGEGIQEQNNMKTLEQKEQERRDESGGCGDGEVDHEGPFVLTLNN